MTTTTARKTAGAFTPTRGGDGGVYRAPAEPKHFRDNGRVVLTGESIAADDRPAFVAALVDTIDPADRAHTERARLYADHGPCTPYNSELADPATLRARYHGHAWGHPRRYHPSQVTSRGMPYDSMFDDAAATAARLQGMLGIDLGWRTGFPGMGPGSGRGGGGSGRGGGGGRGGDGGQIGANAHDREQMFAGMEPAQVRDLVRPRLAQRMTPAEKTLERAASDLIRNAGPAGVRDTRTDAGIYRGTPSAGGRPCPAP